MGTYTQNSKSYVYDPTVMTCLPSTNFWALQKIVYSYVYWAFQAIVPQKTCSFGTPTTIKVSSRRKQVAKIDKNRPFSLKIHQ